MKPARKKIHEHVLRLRAYEDPQQYQSSVSFWISKDLKRTPGLNAASAVLSEPTSIFVQPTFGHNMSVPLSMFYNSPVQNGWVLLMLKSQVQYFGCSSTWGLLYQLTTLRRSVRARSLFLLLLPT